MVPLVLVSLPNYRRRLILHHIFSSEACAKAHKNNFISEVLEYDRMIFILVGLLMWTVPGKRTAFTAIHSSECHVLYAVLGILKHHMYIVHSHLSKLAVSYTYLLLNCCTMHIDDFCLYT